MSRVSQKRNYKKLGGGGNLEICGCVGLHQLAKISLQTLQNSLQARNTVGSLGMVGFTSDTMWSCNLHCQFDFGIACRRWTYPMLAPPEHKALWWSFLGWVLSFWHMRPLLPLHMRCPLMWNAFWWHWASGSSADCQTEFEAEDLRLE